MNKTILSSIENLTIETMKQLEADKNSYGEPIAFVDVLKYDDEFKTMVSIKFTEEHVVLAENEEPYYKAEIVITDEDDDLIDEDMVLTSDGIGASVIKELILNVCQADFSSYCVA